jgi:uncharacterized membrane protein
VSSISITEAVIWSLALAYLVGPGWLLVVGLFPDERPAWQIAVGGGMGIALVGLTALGLSYLPAGITRTSTIIAIIVLNGLFAIVVGWAPERVFQRFSRLSSAVRSCRRPGWKNCVLAAFTFLIFSTFLLVMPSLSQENKESYTEFYIVDGLLEVPPWRRLVNATDPVSLTFAVVSHEKTAEVFQVYVTTEGETIQAIRLGVLEPGTNFRQSISIPARVRSAQQYALILCKDDSEISYRTLYFWLRTPPGAFVTHDWKRFSYHAPR